jgi:Na+-driven multidrug efflux pump
MLSIFVGTVLHVVWNYMLVNYYELGLVGSGIATFLTNLFILCCN